MKLLSLLFLNKIDNDSTHEAWFEDQNQIWFDGINLI